MRPSDGDDDDRRLSSALGAVIGGGGAIAAAGLLAGARGSVVSSNVALVLMVFVVVGAAIGGRAAGVAGAAGGTLAFDFFHTQPYYSLRIDSRDDIETAILLLIGGLIVGQIAAVARAHRAVAASGKSEIERMCHVAELAAQGSPAEQVIAAAQTELVALLGLRACRFETTPYETNLEQLERSGIVVPPEGPITVWRWGRHGFELPEAGVSLAVLSRGTEVGRFVLDPSPGVGSSLEERVVAIAITDQVGAAIGTP